MRKFSVVLAAVVSCGAAFHATANETDQKSMDLGHCRAYAETLASAFSGKEAVFEVETEDKLVTRFQNTEGTKTYTITCLGKENLMQYVMES
jgi:hypothetical protein